MNRSGVSGLASRGPVSPAQHEPLLPCLQSRSPGKERDSETGLDNMGARMYGSTTGRFLRPDDPFADQHPDNPQSWNLYSYVRNNPLSNTDPTGHECASGGIGGDWTWSGSGGTCPDMAEQDTEYEGAENGWSFSWQINASANFLGQELKGVADTTVAPLVNAVEHPVDTVEGVANAVAHPVATAEGIAKATADTAKGVFSGDPRAIGQVAGVVIATAAGVKGAQAEAQGLRPVANRVRSGPRAGELQHVGIVNSKGNIIHIGREGANWHIGLGRGGGASGAGAAIHIPLPSWLGKLLNP